MQQSLTRIVGTHMTLLGLLSTSIMPSAAFAVSDNEPATLSVNVNSVMALTVTSPAAFNGVVPGGAQQKVNANLKVETNSYTGYNITANGSNAGSDACATEVLCSTQIGLTTIPIIDGAASYSGSGAALGTGTELGLVFRLMSVGNNTAGDNETRWGTDTTSELFAAFPVGSAQQIFTQSSNASGSMISPFHILPVTYGISVPASQMDGNYGGTVTYTATSI